MKATRFVPLVVLAPLLLATAAALTVWAAWPGPTTFNPSASITLSSNNSGDNADIMQTYAIPGGDVYQDASAWYTPPEWGVASDDYVPDGTKVGTLDEVLTMGLALGGQTCNLLAPAHFDLLDSTTHGTCFNSVGSMSSCNWNGFDPVCPGGQPRFVCQYPCFLDGLLPSRPLARFAGRADIVPHICALMTFVVFLPGTNLGHGIPAPESWGFPTLTILNETGAPVTPVPTSLADNCTPLNTTITIQGIAGGVASRTNPQYGGTYVFRNWSRGLPDADNDGLENALDTCPFAANAGDPRVHHSGDADDDGLDVACDPNDNDQNLDQDNDGYINRGDNCPLVANGVSLGPDNQADADADGIGNACDPHPNSVDGTKIVKTIEMPVDIAGPVGGIAELPPIAGMGGSPARNYAVLVGLAFVAVVAFAAGGWYARRRWLG